MSGLGGSTSIDKNECIFPTDLQNHDLLEVRERGGRLRLFIVVSSVLYKPRADVVYGYFEEYYDNCSPVALLASNILSVKKITSDSYLILKLIEERNVLRARLGKFNDLVR